MFDKFIIFLPNRLNIEEIDVGCMCSKKIKRCPLIRYFEDKGITVKFRRDISDVIDEGKYNFDDNKYPKLNTLYIHLFNGDYYSDDLYTSKKADREREILFLLAIKLGVKSIYYETEIIETTLSGIKAKVDFENIDLSATYKKSVTKYKGETGKEMYNNRGAPIYILSDTLEQVENHINERFSKLNSSIFSYNFYKNNDNLRLFVYKRFNFKTASIEYTTDIEDNVDIMFDVKTKLMGFGLGVRYDKQVILNERMTYKLEFFDDKELRLSFSNEERMNRDKFCKIREVYDNHRDVNIAIFHITEYVRKHSTKCHFSYRKMNEGPTYKTDYKDRLEKWVKRNGNEKFENECKKFMSSFQIRTWFKQELIEDDEVIINNEFNDNDSDIEEYGILKLKNDLYKDCKDDILKTGNYTSVTNVGNRTMRICDNRLLQGGRDIKQGSVMHRFVEDNDVGSDVTVENPELERYKMKLEEFRKCVSDINMEIMRVRGSDRLENKDRILEELNRREYELKRQIRELEELIGTR
jgi:hypothetical protein